MYNYYPYVFQVYDKEVEQVITNWCDEMLGWKGTGKVDKRVGAGKQDNGDDCGVWVCAWAKNVPHGNPDMKCTVAEYRQ